MGGEREREREREQHGFTINGIFGFGEGGGDNCCEADRQLKGKVGSTMGVLALVRWNQWRCWYGGWLMIFPFVFKKTMTGERK